MKQGFSLIETLIALFISSFVALMIFGALKSTRKITSRLTNMIDALTQITVAYDQLEKDSTPATGIQGTLKNDSFEFFKCTTTHTIQQIKKNNPSAVVVTYRLEKDPHDPQLYQLTRAEAPLGHEKNQAAAIPLLTGLVTWDVWYHPVEAKEKKQERVRTWEEKSAPRYIEYTGVIRDATGGHEHQFSFIFAPLVHAQEQVTAEKSAAPRPVVSLITLPTITRIS